MRQNNQGLSGDEVAQLLGRVAQKLGKTPEQLEAELKSGNFKPTDRAKKVLENKDELQQMMQSPQVRELLRELRGKKE